MDIVICGDHVETRGQAVGVSSCLLPCVTWGWKSGHQTWWQVLLLTELCCQPSVTFSNLSIYWIHWGTIQLPGFCPQRSEFS